MRIGLNGNHFYGGASIEQLADHASSAAADSLATYWMAQAPLGGTDTLTALAVIGRAVPRIEIGTSVVPAYQRHPLTLAAQALTVSAAMGRPLSLGVGLSHRAWMESLGYDYSRPASYMREYLSILVPLVTAGTVDFHGDRLSCTAEIDAGVGPLRVYVGALGPRMLRLAGSLTDGACVAWAGPKSLRQSIAPELRRGAEQAGRPSPRLAVTLPVCVTDDAADAQRRAEAEFAPRGELPSYRYMADLEGVPTPAALAIVGDETSVNAQLDELADAGATDLSVTEFDQTPDEYERTRALMRARASATAEST